MNDLLLKSDGASESSDIEHEDSIHSDFIKSAMPDWLVKSSAQRIGDLRNIPKVVPEWSKGASPAAHLTAKEATQASWQAQNQVDRMLGKLGDVESFAQPLLTQALKEQYDVELDVRETFLRLYSPAKTSSWSLNVSGGFSSRTVSLLSAALHNFAESEIFTADSTFISKPNA
ncbi:MAG: dermonecrotic toxin domain-containing protein, partial [Pseudomonas sp.]